MCIMEVHRVSFKFILTWTFKTENVSFIVVIVFLLPLCLKCYCSICTVKISVSSVSGPFTVLMLHPYQVSQSIEWVITDSECQLQCRCLLTPNHNFQHEKDTWQFLKRNYLLLPEIEWLNCEDPLFFCFFCK